MAATCRTEVKGGEAVVSYAFTNAPVRAVRAFSRRVSPAAVACTLEVETAGGWHLERMAYPEVRVGFAGADARADRLVLEHVGVARVDVVCPVGDALHVDGDVLDQVRELGVHANARREQKECHERQHREHDHVADSCAHRSVDADLLELVHCAAQDEHDDGRPNDDGDRHREDVQ